MSNLNALGYLIDFCCRHSNKPEMTQEQFNTQARNIISSPEGRFCECHNAEDVFRELGWEPI